MHSTKEQVVLNFKHMNEEYLTSISGSECQMLFEFLQVSARPQTGGRGTERHLLSSLVFALRATQRPS